MKAAAALTEGKVLRGKNSRDEEQMAMEARKRKNRMVLVVMMWNGVGQVWSICSMFLDAGLYSLVQKTALFWNQLPHRSVSFFRLPGPLRSAYLLIDSFIQ